MNQILLIEVVLYIGLLMIQIISGIRGKLTETSFALLQISTLSLIMITAGLGAYMSSPYPFGLLIGGIGTILFAIIGYQVARWIYRQVFTPK